MKTKGTKQVQPTTVADLKSGHHIGDKVVHKIHEVIGSNGKYQVLVGRGFRTELILVHGKTKIKTLTI